MSETEKSKQSDAATTEATQPSATVADTSGAEAAAESAGIVGAGATASGFASDNAGDREIVQDAENGIQDGPMAGLADPAESFQEQARGKVFTQDEQGRGHVSIRNDIEANPSSDYPGRDQALAATDSGRLMPGNLDAILRARHAGTQVPGDAQLMSEEEIDALKAQFVDGIETPEVDEEAALKNPNAVSHGKFEVNPNIPTNERALKGAK